MEKFDLESLIAQKLSQRAMAEHFGTSQSTIRHWLKVHGLNTNHKTESEHPGACVVCDRELKTRRRRRCGSCNTAVRRMRTKLRAVALKGGKCQRCAWSGPPAGFDFHHKDDNKEFEIGDAANKAWASIVEEIEKM
jgi:hypothetical protein